MGICSQFMLTSTRKHMWIVDATGLAIAICNYTLALKGYLGENRHKLPAQRRHPPPGSFCKILLTSSSLIGISPRMQIDKRLHKWSGTSLNQNGRVYLVDAEGLQAKASVSHANGPSYCVFVQLLRRRLYLIHFIFSLSGLFYLILYSGNSALHLNYILYTKLLYFLNNGNFWFRTSL